VLRITTAGSPEDHRAADALISVHFTALADSRVGVWEWQSAPKGSTRLLAWWDDELIGHYGMIQYDFQLDQQRIDGAKLEGSFINGTRVVELTKQYDDPDLRGIFRRLIRERMTRLQESESAVLVFGLPNAKATRSQTSAFDWLSIPIVTFRHLTSAGALYPYAQAKARHSAVVARWLDKWVPRGLRDSARPVIGGGYYGLLLARRLRRGTFAERAAGYDLTQVTSEMIDEPTLQMLRTVPGVTIARTRAFLRWRFEEYPDVRNRMFVVKQGGQPVAFGDVMVRGTIATLEDIVVSPGAEACWPVIARYLETVKRELDVTEVQFRIQNTPRTDALLNEIWKSRFFEIGETTPSPVLYFSNVPNASRIADPDFWYVTGAFDEGH
jgi:hypothetical protein